MQPRGIAFDQANGNLFVANWASTTVSLIGTGNTVVATDAFAGQPYQVAFDPANNEMYVLVPNAGGPSSQTGPYTPSAWLVGSYADFPVLGVGDSAGGGPDGAAFDPQNNRMYLADHNTGSVTVIDSNNNLVTTISTGQLAPFAAAFDPANGKVYVTNYSSSTVSVIDPSSNSVTATVSVTGIPQEVLYNPASQDMYIVAHNPSTGAGSVPVLDINNNLVTTIAVGLWPVGIGLNPSSNEMYVANAGSNTVTAISSANQVVTTINVGNTPSSIAYSPLTGYMYVTNAGDNSVGVFSSQTHTVVTTITTGIGKGPRGIAFDKADGFMFVANWGAPTVSIIDSTNKVVATRGVSGQPYQVVFDPANNEMYVLIPNLFGMDTTGGPRVGTAYFVGAIGDFNILANPFFLSATAGTTMMSTATLTRLNFFGDTVALTATPSNSALQCSLSPTSVSMAPSKTVTSTLSCSGTAGAYTVTVTGASTTQSHSFLVYVNVAGFSISANPSSLTLAASTCGTSIITVTSVNGWSGSVTLQASSALTAGFGSCTSFVNPTTITVSSSALTTVTIAITSGTTAATYPVSVTGTANSPALTQSAPITVTVTSSSGGGGGGGGGSIAYGSLITMSDGSKVPVQNLQVGDQMLGYDPTLGKYAVSTVKSITIVDTTNMLVIHTSAGTPFRVDANPRQTLWAKAPDGTTAWTPVTLIKRGDQLLTPNGWVQVTSIEFAPAGIHVMYDIIASVPYFADGYLDPMYKT
jgi:YVTN family beta-propeller protein